MPRNVRITVSDETYARLDEIRKEEGFPGISSYLLHLAGMKSEMSTTVLYARKIVADAVSRARLADIKKEFLLQDLFLDSEWQLFPNAVRIRAGALFLREIESSKGSLVGKVLTLGKSSNGHQRYIRIQ